MPAAAPPSIPPNQSLYIQNLPEKLQKTDLRRELYMLFSTYGPVIGITALKTKAMRGQAHVLFRDVNVATQALRAQNGEEFFGREMRINYSKNRSDTLAKLTGTFHAPAAAANATQAPPSSFPAPPGTTAATTGLPPPPGLKAPVAAASPATSAAGQKRAREESDDDGRENAQDDEEDDGGEMDMSDEDD